MNDIINREEEKEIEDFFHSVETTKQKILNDIETEGVKNPMSLSQIFDYFTKHVKILNVISKKTVEVYIDSIFERDDKKIMQIETDCINARYNFTPDALEKFLTSILIFSDY
jgi:hypothetical protein